MSRLNLPKIAAEGYRSMLGVEAYANSSGLSHILLDLVRLRVSQINGCSFCVDMHARDLREAGETDERLFGLAAWHESPYFTAEERAALRLAEAATRIADGTPGVTDDIWDEAADHFDEASLGALIVAIGAINAWNRFNAVTHNVPVAR